MQKWEYLRLEYRFTWVEDARHMVRDVETIRQRTGTPYKIADTVFLADTVDGVSDYLARLGEEGWELIATTETGDSYFHTLFFKRPKA